MADSTELANEGSLDKPEDAGTGVSGVVKRWLMECGIADKVEKDWRKDARDTFSVYRGKDRGGYDSNQRSAKTNDTFNILWANTETMRPALYNSLPKPDIRRKFRDKDPIGKAVSEILERCVTFAVDDGFDEVMIAAVNDMLVPGRAVTRVEYKPSFKEDENGTEELVNEEVRCIQVSWDRFLHGPGRNWPEVTWIRFKHELTKTEMEDKFPEYAEKVQYDIDVEGEYTDADKTLFKRADIWEIWDKDKREVLFICPNYKVEPLSVTKDPLNLQDFWPIPEPMRSLEDSDSLIPIPEYLQYRTLAKELEGVTNRIKSIIKGLRVRGVYDSRMTELHKLFDAGDNDMLPSENVAAILEAGGIEKAIWMNPIGMQSDVLIRLYEYRQGLLQSIYELIGISDIIRGQSSPSETLGAQQLKADFGSQRLKRKQRQVQKYARDLMRLMVEIIAEKFSPQTMGLMTGLQFPTQEHKMLVQQQLVDTQGQEIPEDIEEMLEKPTVEELTKVMRSDILREYKIDIETNSTIQQQMQEEKGAIVELLQAITEYVTGMAPLVAQGAIPSETAKQLLLAAVRRFDLGAVVEDSLEDIGEGAGEGNGQAQVQQMQQQMQEEKAKMQEQVSDLAEAGEKEINDTKAKVQKEMTQNMTFMKEKNNLDNQVLKAEYKTALDNLKIEADEAELAHQKQLFSIEMENKRAILQLQQKVSGVAPTEQSIAADKARGSRMNDVIKRLSKASGKLAGPRESSLDRDKSGTIQSARAN